MADMLPDGSRAEATAGPVARAFEWLTATLHAEEPEVRHALLLTLPETPVLLIAALFWSLFGFAIAYLSSRAAWPLVLGAADVALLVIRLTLQRRHARAVRTSGRLPRMELLCGSTAWVILIAADTFGLLWLGGVRTTVLGVILATGFQGYVAARFAAFPRLAMLGIAAIDGACTVGLIRSPLVDVRLLGLVAPMAAVAFCTLMWYSHSVLVNALRAELRSRYLSRHDSLTGLLNRRSMHETLDSLAGQMPTVKAKTSFAVLCLDLDGFKGVNDRLGHPAGDGLLAMFAERLVGAVRSADAVSRTGGDEFVVILAGAGRADAAAVAARIVASAGQPYELGPISIDTTTVSIGIALAPEHGTDAQELLARADGALYAVKRKAKGAWRFYGDADPLAERIGEVQARPFAAPPSPSNAIPLSPRPLG